MSTAPPPARVVVRATRATRAAAGDVALGGGGDATWWGSPVRRAPLRLAHDPRAHARGRLHLFTEDGFPEVEIVIRAWAGPSGARWDEIEEPHQPRALTGWVRARALTPLTAVHTRLVVVRRSRRATLSRDGRVIWSAPVGIGAPATPTPPGRYWIREKFRVAGDGLYGTRAFGTSDYSPYETDWPEGGIVGIHGTDQPQLIPGRPSHGCVRVRNHAIERLYRLMPVGTPVIIR